MYPPYGPAAAQGIRLPPSYPGSSAQMPPQAYANYPQQQGQWAGQNVSFLCLIDKSVVRLMLFHYTKQKHVDLLDLFLISVMEIH